MTLLVHTPLPLALSRRWKTCTEARGAAEKTRAVILIVSLLFGTAGLWRRSSSCGAGWSVAVELRRPGVPRLVGGVIQKELAML